MIPYIGSKFNIFDFISPHIPKNPKRYIEPFGGSFGIYFNLDLRDYPDTEFIYNDSNHLNVNLFRFLKNPKFIKKLEDLEFINNDSFLSALDDLSCDVDKERLAKSWLIVLCCGDMKNILNPKFMGNSGFEILKYKLPYYQSYFKRIKLFNLDYKKIFKKYDSEENFFYIDPPYYGFESYYINHNFSRESHLELSKEIKNLKGKWVLSYYKFDEMEDFYSGYNIKSKKSGVYEEFIIYN